RPLDPGRTPAAHGPRPAAPARVRPRRARRGARDVRTAARHPHRLRALRTTTLTGQVMLALFIAVAVLAVAFGGLLAAVDAALSVLSRSDLTDLASHHRAKKSLLAISADLGAHVNAVNFVRVFSEALAAVLVTLTFASVFDDWWWVLLASVVVRSEEHTSELQSREKLVCRLLLEKINKNPSY